MELIMLMVRTAQRDDLEDILQIYNQGIEDRIATLEEDKLTSLFVDLRWLIVLLPSLL